MDSLKNQTILITGGTGSWGQELTKQLLDSYNPSEIRIYSRGEEKQVQMKRKFQDKRLQFVIGDIRDLPRIKQATVGVDYVYHLAALKHVPVCEENPWEAIQTNIIGTQNIITAALENEVNRVVDISTDKAVAPLSHYGMTKACAEKLMIAANNYSQKTTFVIVRAGNVLSTSGSVIPLFKEQIIKNNEIALTDESMSRFFMRLKEAIQMVLDATFKVLPGEILVTKIPSMKITDLGKVMIKKLGNKETRIRYIGVRPGEKLFENLISRDEASRSFDFGKYYLIAPSIKIKGDQSSKAKLRKLKKLELPEYNSNNTTKLSLPEIEHLLEMDGWMSESESAGMTYLKTLSKAQLKNFFLDEGWAKNKNE